METDRCLIYIQPETCRSRSHQNRIMNNIKYLPSNIIFVFSLCLITVIIIEVVLGIVVNDGELGYPPLRYECGSHHQTSHVCVIRLDSSVVQDVFIHSR